MYLQVYTRLDFGRQVTFNHPNHYYNYALPTPWCTCRVFHSRIFSRPVRGASLLPPFSAEPYPTQSRQCRYWKAVFPTCSQYGFIRKLHRISLFRKLSKTAPKLGSISQTGLCNTAPYPFSGYMHVPPMLNEFVLEFPVSFLFLNIPVNWKWNRENSQNRAFLPRSF